MNIVWSFSALEMMADIHEYLSEKSDQAAENYIDGLFESVEKLKKYPEYCGPCRHQKLQEKGYRCCKYKSHIIVYEIDNKQVNILAIIHSKRDPSNLPDI